MKARRRVVFKRREPLGWGPWLVQMVYPRGGFVRATRYVMHRMSRLPDDPHKVARGVFAGCLVGFLPLPGLQFLAAWGAALLVRGNILAALLGTFNTNPVTTPFFAVFSLSFGHWLLGIEAPLSARGIGHAFAHAGEDLWRNVMAIFTDDRMQWGGLLRFWHEVYLPYFIGALIAGLVLSAIAYYLTIPIVRAYQKARAAKAEERSEKRGRLRVAIAHAAQTAAQRVKAIRDKDEDKADVRAGDDSAAKPEAENDPKP
jgi:uncharacterized protein